MKRNTLITLLFTTLVFISTVGIYVWMFRSVTALQNESLVLAGELQEVVSEEERRARIEGTVEEITSQEEVIYQHIVSEETLVDFLESVEDIGAETGATIDIVSVNAREEENIFDINVVIDGRFSPVMRSVGALENMGVHISLVEGTADTILREENDPGIWTASLSYVIGKQ